MVIIPYLKWTLNTEIKGEEGKVVSRRYGYKEEASVPVLGEVSPAQYSSNRGRRFYISSFGRFIFIHVTEVYTFISVQVIEEYPFLLVLWHPVFLMFFNCFWFWRNNYMYKMFPMQSCGLELLLSFFFHYKRGVALLMMLIPCL